MDLDKLEKVIGSSCWGKRSYASKTRAKHALKVADKVYGKHKGLRPYKCLFCEYWHLGHAYAPRSITKDNFDIAWRGR